MAGVVRFLVDISADRRHCEILYSLFCEGVRSWYGRAAGSVLLWLRYHGLSKAIERFLR